jgi:WD40 repeat protein
MPRRLLPLTALLTLALLSSPADADKSYEPWVEQYSLHPREPHVLIITFIHGEAAAKKREKNAYGSGLSVGRFLVDADGAVSTQWITDFSTKGSSGSRLQPEDLKRLEQLIDLLPADTKTLPPDDRKVMLQTGAGPTAAARVYDRANLPSEVISVLRASGSGVGSWVPTFAPASETKTSTNPTTQPAKPAGLHTVIQTPTNEIHLWDNDRNKSVAKLADDCALLEYAVSPDHSLIATIMHPKKDPSQRHCDIRVWKTATGELVHELRPFEQKTCEYAAKLTWTADSNYLLAANKSHAFWSTISVGMWNLKTGRYAAEFQGASDRITSITLSPDGAQLIAETKEKTRTYDFTAAMKTITAHEKSLPRVAEAPLLRP